MGDLIIVSGNWKRCGTCEFWTGQREPRRGDVTFLSGSALGACIGRWKGSKYDESHSGCSGWKKWGVLE